MDAIKVAGREGIVPTPAEYGAVFTRLFDSVANYLTQNGSHPMGGGIALYKDEEYIERDIHVEAVFPIPPNAPPGNAEVKIYTLPAVAQMACVVHEGPYDGLKAAYGVLMGWLAANDYQIVDSVREVYVHYDTTTPLKHITEIQCPVQKV